MTQPNQKLDWKFIGPFQILERYGKNAYRLDLPTRFKFHDVFHVFLLEKDSSDVSTLPRTLLTVRFSKKNKVRDRALAGLYYLIHWINQPESECTWKHVASIKHLKRLISQFHHQHLEAAASAKKPKPRVGTKQKAAEPTQSEPQLTRVQLERSGKREKGSWRTEDFV